MSEIIDPAKASRLREALITLTAIHYIEEQALLDAAQLADAKQSLQALFLRTSGAETMLRRLIELLKIKRNVQNTFSKISGTIGAVRRSVATMGERVDNLRRLIQRSPVSAEAHAEFIGPFLSFSMLFLKKINAFEKAFQQYLAAREQEARAQTIFRLAHESRERLRQRLTGNLAQSDGTVENRIRGELSTSLNYGEAEAGKDKAERQAFAAEAEVQAQLKEIHVICQAAAEPAKRDKRVAVLPEQDLYVLFGVLEALESDVSSIKEPVRELLKLYQHADGMFQLDYMRLKQALQRLGDGSGAYFQAKEEDRDITSKREKLRKIETMIQFLERVAQLTTAKELDTFPKFSKAFSDTIAEPRAPWAHSAEDSLPAKVRAEADLSTWL
ncbi:MAG: hypothetical protein HY308_10505 [Gammaproteobacteria bacterium]|nr:hypothetical protein [Gammaproteobacteria bacterium]